MLVENFLESLAIESVTTSIYCISRDKSHEVPQSLASRLYNGPMVSYNWIGSIA